MKQLQALTDGPCCKPGAAAVTETAGRQMQRQRRAHGPLSLMFAEQHLRVSSHNIHLKQIFEFQGAGSSRAGGRCLSSDTGATLV